MRLFKLLDHLSPLRLSLCIGAAALAASPLTSQQVLVKERWSTTGVAGTLEFGSVDGMAEAGNGSIWISDARSRVVAVLGPDGRGLRIVSRQGDGPGEVKAPTLITRLPDGGIGVYDLVHSAVEIFEPQGQFERRVRLSDIVLNPKGFAALPSGGFVLSGGIPSVQGALHHFNPAGRLIRSWRAAPRAKDARAGTLIAGGPVSVTADGSLLFSQAAPHRIEFHSTPGAVPRLLASHPNIVPPIGDRFVQIKNGKRTFQWHFLQSAGVFRLRDGNVLNIIWNSPQKLSVWEVYRPDGKLLARQRVSRAYRPWGIAQNGDMLASYEDPVTGEQVVTRLEVRVR